MPKVTEFKNVQVRCRVSRTIQYPKFNPYTVDMEISADVPSETLKGVKAELENMFIELSNTVADSVDSFVESYKPTKSEDDE